MKLSDRIEEIRIPLTRKNLAIMAIGMIVYSLIIVIIYDNFFRIKTIKVSPSGAIEYQVHPR
jgi:hypothetical protein